MEKHKIDRINELARKKKSDGLTDEEAAEHAVLRQEYIAGFRENMRQVLETHTSSARTVRKRNYRKRPQQNNYTTFGRRKSTTKLFADPLYFRHFSCIMKVQRERRAAGRRQHKASR